MTLAPSLDLHSVTTHWRTLNNRNFALEVGMIFTKGNETGELRLVPVEIPTNQKTKLAYRLTLLSPKGEQLTPFDSFRSNQAAAARNFFIEQGWTPISSSMI